MHVEVRPFCGWANNLHVGNGTIELVVTLDVGPRILSYARKGGISPFKVFEDQSGGVSETAWRSRGGHRLWLAPESRALSYFPDNAPVAWKMLDDQGVRLTPAPESGPGFQKEIDLHLSEIGSNLRVIHRVRRVADTPQVVAPWAITVMAPGGWAILPQPVFGEHPRDMLPNRRLILWPYTDLSDRRCRFGRRYFTVQQDSAAAPIKIGLADSCGWSAYFLNGTLFVKRFSRSSAADYPDEGSNLEVFTNGKMLELETLGPLVTLQPGESVEHIEAWDLHDGLACDPTDQDAIDAMMLRLGPREPDPIRGRG